MKHALVTGGAGFIGSHLLDRLLAEGWRVTAVDNFDPFYDPSLKRKNLERPRCWNRFRIFELDIRDVEPLRAHLPGDFDVIVHLAAKAGVRPSIADPLTYQQVNVCGTRNMLEMAKYWGVSQFVFASSSSVYGVNPNVPWSEEDRVLRPISPYASTKVSGELLGHVYSHLYGIKFLALRFFTVYGPRQRPDLAIHKFTRSILEGRPIPLFGDGSTRRDYTYAADIVAGIRAAMDYRQSPYEIVNLGNNRTVGLMEMIRHIEDVTGAKAKLDRRPEQPGDAPQTWADVSKAKALLGYEPRTNFRDGLRHFAEWLQLEMPEPQLG